MNNTNQQADDLTDLFGPVIYSYTRAQAIDDGVLVDVTDTATEAGFMLPVAVTRSVWDQYIEWDHSDNNRQTYQDESGRLWDVLYMARQACIAVNKGDSRETLYEFYCIPRGGKGRLPRRTALKVHIGPGDGVEPVITIMLPNED